MKPTIMIKDSLPYKSKLKKETRTLKPGKFLKYNLSEKLTENIGNAGSFPIPIFFNQFNERIYPPIDQSQYWYLYFLK